MRNQTVGPLKESYLKTQTSPLTTPDRFSVEPVLTLWMDEILHHLRNHRKPFWYVHGNHDFRVSQAVRWISPPSTVASRLCLPLISGQRCSTRPLKTPLDPILWGRARQGPSTVFLDGGPVLGLAYMKGSRRETTTCGVLGYSLSPTILPHTYKSCFG